MKLKTAEEIMSASIPQELFSMNPDTIEQEYDGYVERFKPSAYNNVRNFLVTQKVTVLYRKALSQLNGINDQQTSEYSLVLTDENGNLSRYDINYEYDVKLGKMYVTDSEVIFVVYSKFKKYYDNFVSKASKIPKLNKGMWSKVQYSFPDITSNYKTSEGNYVIVTRMPCKIYPLREVLNYFGGKLKPEYVASMVTRLCYFVCYMDILGMNHNGITVDNLFFAPGRTVEEGEAFTVNDMRIVGVYGGWFFTTNGGESIIGMPKEVHDVMPDSMKKQGYSSFVVDMLSVKRVARELLGDVTGNALENVPEPMRLWVNNITIHKNAYEEYRQWESVVIQSYGKHRFVNMDISI